MVQPTELARENGDGSRSGEADLSLSKAYRHDERAETETTYWESDIEKLEVSERRKRQLRKSLRRQEGENQNEAYYSDRQSREQQNRGEDNRRLTQIYAGRFGMTPHQKRRSLHLVMDVFDLSEFAHFTKDQAVLGVINTVAREDGRFIEDEEDFRRAAEEQDLAYEDLRTLRNIVRRRL